MPVDYPSLSVRLPPKTMKALETAAKKSGRTRSAVAKEILQTHFDAEKERKERFDRLLAMAGAGAPYSTYKSAEEIDATIRYLRGDD